MVNVGKIYSILGNSNALTPLAIKDFAATGGMTASSFVTGKEEGQDRLIDESGTEVIWLLGLPGTKWIFDKTVFKMMGLDAKFDARNLKDKDIFEKIQQYAPDEKVKNSLDKIAKNQKLFKNTVTAKFFITTALTVGSYIGLTKFKQNYTEKKIRNNLIAEYEANKKAKVVSKTSVNNSIQSTNEDNEAKSPSFKGLSGVIETFAFSPVRNMWILDGSITGERLKDSRTPQEFFGYGIKEFFTLCFMYYASDEIKKRMENWAKEKHNKTIALDARVIEEGKLKKSFEDGSIVKSLDEFKAANTSKTALYEFLHNNPDNMIVKAAKDSDIIKLYEKTNKIDTREYINLDHVERLNKSVDELYKEYKQAIAKGKTSEEFFKSVKKLKRQSILTSLGTCIFALGVVAPGLMLLKRFTSGDDKEFQTKKLIREQLIREGIIQ